MTHQSGSFSEDSYGCTQRHVPWVPGDNSVMPYSLIPTGWRLAARGMLHHWSQDLPPSSLALLHSPPDTVEHTSVLEHGVIDRDMACVGEGKDVEGE